MTGMCNFNPLLTLCAATALLVVSSFADKIVLEGDARMTGTVSSIAEGGVVELVTPLSPEPVLLKGEGVSKVIFSEAPLAEKLPAGRIELINGDVLPVAIETLDETQLTAVSPVAGRLVIPRKSLKALHLGVFPNRVIYAGPTGPQSWIRDGANAENWEFEDGVIAMHGSGKMSRKLATPQQFIVKFRLNWRVNPNFQFSFADPLLPQNQTSDRYYFQYGSAGVEIKRESTTGRRYTTIVMLNRTPDQYVGNEMEVEIRVDRAKSMLALYINGEPEGKYNDPVLPAPNGQGISIVSNSNEDSGHELREIEILEWDDAGDRHRTEDRGDATKDALIERRGDRFGGKLLSILPSPDGALFSFKGDFQEQPIELPDSEVSTVFFSEQAEAASATGPNPFLLRLRGDGTLRVSSCSFSGDRIEAVHPLLGPVSLTREGVAALERAELSEKGGEK